MSKVVVIKLHDGDTPQNFRMTTKCAMQSELLAKLVDSDKSQSQEIKVPVRDISANTMSLIMEYLKHHQDSKAPQLDKPLVDNLENVLDSWDYQFLKKYLLPSAATKGLDELLKMVRAANYFSIPSLVDLTCAAVASEMKGKSPEELRKMFNLVNDFSRAEQQQLQREEVIPKST